MAGNALPMILLGAAALLMFSKRGEAGEAPEEKPDETPGEGEPEPEPDPGPEGEDPDVAFDPASLTPRIEEVGEFQAWMDQINSRDPRWLGSIEFADMDPELETLAAFIETELGGYGDVYGRVVDRDNLEPEAAAAMAAENPQAETLVTQAFAENPGLESIIMFLQTEGQPRANAYFLFDSDVSQQTALPKIQALGAALSAAGVDSTMRYGYAGMTNPEVESGIKAFLAETLPKKFALQGVGV
jgi:hypothetical protein